MTDLRALWPDEATYFTPWVTGNLRRLGEVIGAPLAAIGREVRDGRGIIDIVARVGADDVAVIENQFGWADGDHLGRLIVYAHNLDATAAVLIAEDFQSEMLSTIGELNRVYDGRRRFYAVLVRRVGDTAVLALPAASPARADTAARTMRSRDALWRRWAEFAGDHPEEIDGDGGRMLPVGGTDMKVQMWCNGSELKIGLRSGTATPEGRAALARRLELGEKVDPTDHWLGDVARTDDRVADLRQWLPRYLDAVAHTFAKTDH